MSDLLVVMPAYNAEDFIESAIESLYSNKRIFDFVVCDDCSTDNTYNIIEILKTKYDFKVMKNENNLGTGLTVNRCIDSFKDYKYYTWISADNLLNDNFIEELYCQVINSDITFSNFNIFETIDGNISYDCEHHIDTNVKNLQNRYNLGPSFMFKKETYNKCGPFDARPGEDYMFAVKCAINNMKFSFVNKSLMKYRRHLNSVSGRLQLNIIDNNNIATYEAMDLAKAINS